MVQKLNNKVAGRGKLTGNTWITDQPKAQKSDRRKKRDSYSTNKPTIMVPEPVI